MSEELTLELAREKATNLIEREIKQVKDNMWTNIDTLGLAHLVNRAQNTISTLSAVGLITVAEMAAYMDELQDAANEVSREREKFARRLRDEYKRHRKRS